MSIGLLSIIIPVYNEEKEVVNSVAETQKFLNSYAINHEILVVDDGSSDNTHALMQAYAKTNPDVKLIAYEKNHGKGYAIKMGMLSAKGDYRLFFDIDLSVPLETIRVFLDEIEKNTPDIVIGTRKSKASNIIKHQPFYREFLGKGFTKLTNFILGIPYNDITCGFKCFSARSSAAIFPKQTIERWSFDSEILSLAQKFNFKVSELPVTWENSADTRVRLFRDIVISLFELLKIRFTNYK